jgi:hypothetical protein
MKTPEKIDVTLAVYSNEFRVEGKPESSAIIIFYFKAS